MRQIKINWKINQVILFFWFDPFQRLGQKSKNNFVGFLEEMKTRKFASEIYWPLAKRTHTHSRKYHDLHFARKHVLKISSTIQFDLNICTPTLFFENIPSSTKLNEYETDPCILYFLKYDSWLFINFCVFTRFYLFLPDVNLKLFWQF